MREVADVAGHGELLFDDPFHRPVHVLDVGERGHGVERAEGLGQVEHVVGEEEVVAVFPPVFAQLRAEILVRKGAADGQGLIHLQVHQVCVAVETENQIRAVLFDAQHAADQPPSLGLVVQADHGRAADGGP